MNNDIEVAWMLSALAEYDKVKHFSRLPPLIRNLIYNYMSAKTLSVFSRVCRAARMELQQFVKNILKTELSFDEKWIDTNKLFKILHHYYSLSDKSFFLVLFYAIGIILNR